MAPHRWLRHLAVASVMVTALLISAAPAPAASITPTVFTDDATNNSNCTLREAVIAANTNMPRDLCQAGSGVETDVIVLAEGTYVLNILGVAVETDPAADDLDLSGSLAIDGPPGGASIDQQAAFRRVIQVLPGAAVTLSDLTITGGNPLQSGGGIFNQQALALRNVTVAGNSSYNDGGGILTTGPNLSMVNSTLSANQSERDGGGLFQIGASSNSILSSVTVTGNRADSDDDGVGDGGGVTRDSGVMTIRNTIVGGNVDSALMGNNAPDCSGSIVSDGFNLIGTQTGACTLTGTTTGNLTGEPGLGPLGPNGGPTETHLPQPGSQVIDAGNPSGCLLPTDQRGVARMDGDGDGTVRCDIGSVEALGPKSVHLKAKPRKLERGEKTRLKAVVSPCSGREGELVEFFRKHKLIGTKKTSDDCVATKKTKVIKTTKFHAVSPKQDADPFEGVSNKVKVRVRED